MNHIYRLVWNSAKGVWQAVAEHARGSKKAAASHENRAHHTVDEIGCSPILGKLAGALFLAFPMPLLASDLPQGGSIVGGSGQISQSGATMTVTQTSERMAADWQSFNIGAGHTVNFVQPSASAAALNRVVGADVSLIQGALNANGQVFLVNPNGILFSPTAQVNVGGLIASTLGVSTADFMAGKYNFEGAGSNAIINRGNIVATGASDEGGTIALIAAKVINEGVLTASAGNVLIGAGTKVTLDLGGPVKLQVEQGVIDALIEQGGAIKADGGLVYLSAKAAGDLAATVINHTGITQAQTLITGETGEIFLMGGLETDRIQVGGRLDASAPRGGDGGFIETSAAKVRFDDDLAVTTLAPQGHTGHWLIDPNDFTVAASGGDMTGAFLSSSLASNDVTIQSVNGGTDGNGDIFVNDAVTWNSATRLTLDAIRHIEINADISALHSNGELALMYGQGAVAAGNTAAYSFGPGAKVNLRAGDNFFTMLGNDGTEVAW
jgi:filamentous hemagglutinin family protein